MAKRFNSKVSLRRPVPRRGKLPIMNWLWSGLRSGYRWLLWAGALLGGMAGALTAGNLVGHVRDRNWYAQRSPSDPLGTGYYEFAVNANATNSTALGGFASTGVFGEFSMANLPAGSYAVASWSVWWRPAFAFGVAVPASGDTADVDLRLNATMWGYAAFWEDTGYYEFGQTFAASGPVTMIYLRDPLLENFGRTVTVHEGGPGGAQVGVSRSYGSGGDQRFVYGFGQMPTVAGRTYYLRVRTASPATAGVLMQMDPRPDYSDPMPGGCLWLGDGTTLTPYPDRDLGVTIMADDDGFTTDIFTRPGGGATLSGTTVGQSFVARGVNLISAAVWVGDGSAPVVVARVLNGGPGGAPVGTSKRNKPARLGGDPEMTVVWAPGECPLVPNQTYYLELSREGGGTLGSVYANPYNQYADGQAYTNGVAISSWDLAANLMQESSTGSATRPPVRITADPAVAEAERQITALTIRWTTDLAADSLVEFAPGNPPYTDSIYDATLTGNHSVTLSNLAPHTMYHYRVVSSRANCRPARSRDFVICTRPLNANLLANPGFEEGSGSSPRPNPPGWTEWSGSRLDMKASDGTWFYPLPVHGGSWMLQGSSSSSSCDGYLYQQVTVTPGQAYTFSAWVATWPRENSTWKYDVWNNRGRLVYAQLGLDPTGGTTPTNRTVQWSPRMYSHLHWTQWARQTTAQNTNLTAFIRLAGEGEEFHLFGLDDLELSAVGGTAGSIAQPFETPPAWDFSYDAAWGNAASFYVTNGGQSGRALQITRTGPGSSTRTQVFPVRTNTLHVLSVYGRCPALAASYWAECAFKLGRCSAQDFDENPNSWTLVKKFSDAGINGNGNAWTQYTTNFLSGSQNQVSVGFKLGAATGPGPLVGWDTLQITPVILPSPQLAVLAASNRLVITFVEAVDSASATNPSNYLLARATGGSVQIPTAAQSLDATNIELTLAPLPPRTDYLLSISNVFGVAPPPGTRGSNGQVLVRVPYPILTNGSPERWQYEQSGTDWGTAWRARNFYDRSWPAGSPLFAYETCGCLPDAIRTTLATNAAQLTFYFRYHFDLPSGGPNVFLRLRHLVDDGAVFYFNGTEIGRVGLTNEPVYYTNTASRTIDNAAWEEPWTVLVTNAEATNNVLAVEVHQVRSDSTDVAFGATLEALLPPSLVPVPRPVLHYLRADPQLILNWSEPGFTLQTAPQLRGPYTSALEQIPPLTVRFTNSTRFFRLQSP